MRQYTSDRERDSIFSPVGLESISHEIMYGRSYYWVDMTPTEDGGAALVVDALLMVVDKNGTPLWSKQYLPGGSVPHNLAFSSVIKIDDGFILRAVYKSYLSGQDTLLMRLDDCGNVVWAKEYPTIHSVMNAPLVLTDDGHLLIGGYVEAAKGRTKGAVAKIGLDGSVDWVSTVQMEDWREGSKTSMSSGLQTLGLAENGDIILIQNYDACPGCSTTDGALISRLSPNGEHIWSKQFHFCRTGGNTLVMEVQPDGEDLLLVGGSTGFQEPAGYTENFNAMIAKMNKDGDPLWVRSVGRIQETYSEFEHSEDFASSFLVTDDGRLLLTGSTNSFSGRQPWHEYQEPSHFDLLLAVADSNGLVHGIGELMSTADITNPYEVWSKTAQVTVESADESPQNVEVSVEDCTYTVSDADPQSRSVGSEDVPLKLVLKSDSKELMSNISIFEDVEGDIDGDTLKQEWENAALELLNPIIEVDEEEDWLQHRDSHHVANFVRVTPWPSADDPRYILFFYAVTWAADYGGVVLVSGQPFTAAEDHRGDTERIIMAFRLISERRVKLEWVYTSAHGGVNSHSGVWHATDRTCNRGEIVTPWGAPAGSELMCGKLRFNNKGQLLVQASEDKHATYPTKEICEAVSLLSLPLHNYGEDCGWEPSKIPVYSEFQWKESDFQDDPRYRGHGLWQFDTYNAGEPEPGYQLIDDLDLPESWRGLTEEQVKSLTGLFPGETVWTGVSDHTDGPNNFCGGLDTDDVNWFRNPDKCSSAIALRDPPEILVEKLESLYRISITTGNKSGAGTDAYVSIELTSDSGQLHLDGTFEKGDVDVFHVGSRTSDLGAAPYSEALARRFWRRPAMVGEEDQRSEQGDR